MASDTLVRSNLKITRHRLVAPCLLLGQISEFPTDSVWLIDCEMGFHGNGITVTTSTWSGRIGNVDHRFSAPGAIEIELSGGDAFSDEQLDANGDGRFSERDWYLIEDLLGSTIGTELEKYNVYIEEDADSDGDFDEHQIIAQEDLGIIRSLLDAGLGAGEFGDLTGMASSIATTRTTPPPHSTH